VHERRYDEKEVARIIQRAAEIQAGTLPSGETGTSLAEIQRIAAEIGIDPAAIETAARQTAVSGTGPLDDKPDRSQWDETVFGEMDEDKWDECVALFRKLSGQAGESTVSPGRYEWTGNDDAWGMTVTATVRSGKTRVRLFGRTDTGTAIIWTLCLAVGFIASLATGAVVSKFNPAGAAIGAASGVATLFLAAAFLLERRHAIVAGRRFRKTMMSVLQILAEGEEPASDVRQTLPTTVTEDPTQTVTPSG